MKLMNPIKLDKKEEKKRIKKRRTVRKNGFLNKIIKKKKVGENKRNRDKEIKKRKNFLPSLILTIVFWLITFYIIYFINPLEQGSVQIFFLSVFLSLLFTLSLLFGNSRRGFLFTVSIILFLILRYFGIGNLINVLLIAGLTITIEVYFSKK